MKVKRITRVFRVTHFKKILYYKQPTRPVVDCQQEDRWLIEALLNVEAGLEDKEIKFIEDMARMVIDQGGQMYFKQRRWAELIAQRLEV